MPPAANHTIFRRMVCHCDCRACLQRELRSSTAASYRTQHLKECAPRLQSALGLNVAFQWMQYEFRVRTHMAAVSDQLRYIYAPGYFHVLADEKFTVTGLGIWGAKKGILVKRRDCFPISFPLPPPPPAPRRSLPVASHYPVEGVR